MPLMLRGGAGRNRDVALNPKFKHLFGYWKWIVYHGGRSSGKSTSIGIAIISLIENGRCKRVLCCRQFAVSIKESVYAQIESAATILDVHDNFLWQVGKVIHKKSGAIILFAGLDRNKGKIKGFVDADICWIEEASEVSAGSWRFLIPTIARNEGHRFFVSFNNDLESDWTYQNFIKTNHYKAIVEKVNFEENKHNTQDIYDLAEADKQRDYDEYLHVWEGECRSAAKDAVFKLKWIKSCITKPHGCDNGAKMAGFDVADEGDDANALAIKKGSYLYYIKEWHDTDPNSAARYVNRVCMQEECPSVRFDSIGVGAGAKGEFRRLNDGLRAIGFNAGMGVERKDKKYRGGLKNRDMFANLKAQAYWCLRDKMYNSFQYVEGDRSISINDCMFISSDIDQKVLDKFITELSSIKFEYRSGKVAIQKKSESADSSPNIAESVIMAFYESGTSVASLFK